MPSVTISVFCADTVACHMQQLGALRVRWVPPGVASSSPDCPPDCSIRNSQACSKAQPSLLSPSPDDRSHRSQRGDYHTARRLAPTRLPSEHCRRRHSCPCMGSPHWRATSTAAGPLLSGVAHQSGRRPRATRLTLRCRKGAHPQPQCGAAMPPSWVCTSELSPGASQQIKARCRTQASQLDSTTAPRREV